MSVEVVDTPPFRQDDQTKSPLQWTTKRYRHVIRLKEEALRMAKKLWADYIWVCLSVFFVTPQSVYVYIYLQFYAA